MRIKSHESVSRIKRFFYLWRLYRLVNSLLKRGLAERDASGVDFSELPADNRKVLIVTIAFNNDAVLRHQIEHIRKFLQDSDVEYLVADNSPLKERQEVIRALCEEMGVSYIKIPNDVRINKISGSYSHGAAATWIYYNYIIKRRPYCFGFIDHDLFPIRHFSIAEKLGDAPYYGFRDDRGGAWYLWMGLLFFKFAAVKDYEINFLPCKVNKGEVYLDTGGSLWYTLYSKLGSEGCNFPDRVVVPVYVNGKRYSDPIDYIDDCWMHTNNGSNWKKKADKQDMLTIIWEKYQNSIPDEIHF